MLTEEAKQRIAEEERRKIETERIRKQVRRRESWWNSRIRALENRWKAAPPLWRILWAAVILFVGWQFLGWASSVVYDRDCSDFDGHRQAQVFYYGFGGPLVDWHNLDGDRNGQACERGQGIRLSDLAPQALNPKGMRLRRPRVPRADGTAVPSRPQAIPIEQAKDSLVNHLMACVLNNPDEYTRTQMIKEIASFRARQGRYDDSTGRWELVGPGAQWNLEAGRPSGRVVETTWYVDWSDVWPAYAAGVLFRVLFCEGQSRLLPAGP